MRTTRKLLLALLTVSFIFAVSCSQPKAAPNQPVQDAAQPAVSQPDTTPPEEGLTPPEAVRSEEMHTVNRVKFITVGNAQGHYHLSCNADFDSCATPIPGKDYLVFSKQTRWRFPGAKATVTLKWFQDWSISYNHQENIALVRSDFGDVPSKADDGTFNPGDGRAFGIYILDSWSKTK